MDFQFAELKVFFHSYVKAEQYSFDPWRNLSRSLPAAPMSTTTLERLLLNLSCISDGALSLQSVSNYSLSNFSDQIRLGSWCLT